MMKMKKNGRFPDAGAQQRQHRGRQIDYGLTPSHVLRLLLRGQDAQARFEGVRIGLINNATRGGPSPETLWAVRTE